MKIVLCCSLLMLAVLPVHADLPQTLGQVDRSAPCFRWPAVDVDGDGVYDRVDHCPGTPAGCTVNASGCSTDGDGDGVCDGVDRCPDTPAGTEVDDHGCSAGHAALTTPPREAPAPAAAPPAHATESESERRLVETGTLRLENVYFESNARPCSTSPAPRSTRPGRRSRSTRN